MRADLTAERERLSDRIADLDALLMFTLRDREIRARCTRDRNGAIYCRARQMLAWRRRNNAVDALMAIDLAMEDRRER